MSYPVYYVEEGDTLPHLFSTYDGGTGASITMSGLAVTDIEIYKDGSVTQRSSDSGYTLLDTDGTDFDGVTGIHGFSIDLSDNTDTGFFSVGPWYHVVVSSVTVDAQTVNFVACAFRIVSATRGMAGTALPNAAADAAGGLPISDAGGLDLDALNSNVTAIVADTNELQTDWVNGGRLDLLLDACSTHSAADVWAVVTRTLTAATNITSDGSAITMSSSGVVGTVNLVNTTTTNTDMITTAQVNTECDTALSDIGLHLLVNTALPTGWTTDVTANSALDYLADDGTATYDRTTDSLQALRDRGDAAWTTGAGGSPPDLLVSTTIATLASQTSFTLTAGSADDDAYNGAMAVVTDSATSTQKAVGRVSDYTGSTKTIALASDPGIFTMAVGDTIEIVSTPTQVTDILADTNELQTDWADGGRLDLILDARASQTSVDTVDTVVDAIKVVTDALPDAGALTTIDANIDAILLDTGTDGVLVSSGTGTGQISLTSGVASANMVQISGDATAADNLEESATAIVLGAAAAGTLSTTQMTTNLTEATDDHYIGRIIVWTSGVLAGQATDVTDYTGSTKLLTFTAITEAPSASDTFVIV